MKRLLQIYVYGQWHIALCATAFYIGGSKLFDQTPDIGTVIHVFSATLFVYLAHRIYGREKMQDESFKRYSFLIENLWHAQLTALAGAIVAIISFFFLNFNTQVILVFSGIISLGYILPLVYRRRLRDIGMLKIFFISIVWALIPVLSNYTHIPSQTLTLFILENFLFIFALTIPFDIRDEHLDKRVQISNLTNRFSISQLRFVMLCLILFCMTIVTFLYFLNNWSMAFLITMMVFYSMQIIATFRLDKKHSEMYYLLFLDGMISIKAVLWYYTT